MKRMIPYLLAVALLPCLNGCLEYDNYQGPDATLTGKITDRNGDPLWVESGGGIRIKLMDYGWSDVPAEQYLKVRMDGTYTNTKVFAGTYDIVAEGPFVPLVQVDGSGAIVVDETKKGVRVKGTTQVDFQVEPFLRVAWVGEPEFDAQGRMSVSFRVDRGTANPAYRLDVFDIGLFVSTTRYVGENNYDPDRSIKITNSATATAALGTTATLTTPIPLKNGHTYYIRVGARMNYTTFGGIIYNYTDVRKIIAP